MSEVLGSLSFLDTPDVNGTLVLLAGDAPGSITGTTNQIAVSGTLAAPVIGLANNPIFPGIASITLPSGATADRPVSPQIGMQRYNTTIASTEYYNGSAWIPAGSIIQTVVGNIAAASSNAQIPYDNTVPTSAEGFQLWSQSFTPILPNSLILIISSGFYAVASTADVYATQATFNGTTCFSAALVGFSTSTGEGRGFSIISTQTSGSTATRTYSARMGPQSNVTVYYNQGTGGQAYGGTVNLGKYIIQEIAP